MNKRDEHAKQSSGRSSTERLTPRHWIYFTLITLVLLSDGMDVTIVSHVFPTLIKSWGVSVGGGIAFVVAVGFLSMGLGAVVAGGLSDRWGRKSVLIGSVVVFGGATALGGTAGDFTAFAAWRILACLGMGAAMASGNTLLADLIPERRRAALLATAYAGVGLGTTVGAALAGTLLPTSGWRVLLVVGGLIPLAIIAVLAAVVPESPAFVSAKRRTGGAAFPASQGQERRAHGSSVLRPGFEAPVSSTILAPPLTPTTVLLWLFGFFSLGTQLLIAQYLPTLLQLPVPGLDTLQSSTIVGVYGFASVLGGVILGAILARASRFLIIGIVLGLAAVMSVVVYLLPDPEFGSLIVVLGITGFILPTAFGPTRSVLAAMAYPAHVRGAGIGVAEFGGRLGAAAGGVAGGTLIAAGTGLSGLFLILLLPIGVLLGSLAGLRRQARRTRLPEPTGVSPTGPAPAEGATARATAAE
ncbi:MFS transporter [Arthrobacter sp. EH-1B-1]|uniref:MFS transporter n=1 Tax=Arthrobacter vasquezii TaxID=2977629 RepID=A0ABT6CV19_9MICC|nr:MFS transporter [Arthrobacter vasquezii]MDF9277922.1 MFS transporter [Arthrobacter vasquezii]